MNPATTPALQPADLAWMLVSIALVMLMIPGLCLFYAGMVRAKNVLATMMQAMAALAVVGTLWILVGYALAFGADVGGLGVLGFSSAFIALHGVAPTELWPGSGVPIWVHATFQGMFAVITPALVAGALAERLRFSAWCLWMAAWSLLVYAPLAHMVWHPGGWLFRLGALDFAGGTVVHVAAGVSALVAAKLIRQRHGWPERPIHPSGAAHTLLGAGLLWVGWFGFNGGAGGALLDGNFGQLGLQALSVVATAAFAGPLTALLVYAVGRDRLAVDPGTEERGLDGALHGERAFDLSEDAVTALDIAPRAAARPPRGAALTWTIAGLGPGELSKRWAAACAGAPTDPAMVELLHHVTRVREGEIRLYAVDAAWAIARVELSLPGCVATISSTSQLQGAQS